MPNEVAISIIAVDAASDILKKIGSQFGVLGEIGVASITAVASAFGLLVKAGEDAQDTQARFDALVDNSPLSGFKANMENMADTWAKSTRFQRDNILAAEGQLSIYTNISQKTFPDALKASLNLATYMKGDATQGAETLGKALEDISGGSLTLLVRQRLLTREQADHAKALASTTGAAKAYSYEFNLLNKMQQKNVEYFMKIGEPQKAYSYMMGFLTQSQKDHAAALAKDNTQLEAQQYVMDILNGKIGDLATTMGQTFAGQADIFNNKWREFTEGQGLKILDTLAPIMGDLNELADYVLPAVGRAFDVFVIPTLKSFTAILDDLLKGKISGGEGLKKILDGLFGGFESGTGSLLEKVKGIDWKKLSDNLAEDIKNIDWTTLGAEFGNGLRNLIYAGWEIVSKTDWGAVLGASAHGFADFTVSMFEPGKTWDQDVRDVWKGNGQAVTFMFPEIFRTIGREWGGNFHAFLDITKNSWADLSIIWGPVFDTMGDTVKLAFKKYVLDKIMTGIDTWKKDFKLGEDIITKMIKQFQDNASALGTALQKVISDAVAGALAEINRLLGIKTAKPVGQGHAQGADFIVPPGYPNDSFPLRAQSGERVIILPSGQAGNAAPALTATAMNGKTLHNHGTIQIFLKGDDMTVSRFMDELGAAMG
jgi:hypothetical protein